jgi:hypothetical protein
VFGKGFEPAVMMVRLQSLLTGVPYDQLPEGELLALEGEDGPWIMQLSEELHDIEEDARAWVTCTSGRGDGTRSSAPSLESR